MRHPYVVRRASACVVRRASACVVRRASAAALLALAACEPPAITTPPPAPSLDAQLRQSLQNWGALPIGPVPAQSPALVDLGRSLFFDKILSGNRDVSCATCHDAIAHFTDGMALAVGTGGVGAGATRQPGSGREFVPRNASSLLNEGIGFFYIFWDGRLNEEGGRRFNGPPGVTLPDGLNNLVAAQAVLPLLNRVEMRGQPGDRDRFGAPNELAEYSDAAASEIWKATMQRLLSVQEYVAKFNGAFPSVPVSSLGIQHAANALAAFQVHALTKTNSSFDRYLARDNSALTDEEKRGALIFFGKGRCSSCHSGALLGGQQFANIGVPQFGPGVGNAAPLDIGRAEHLPANQQQFYKFSFRVPPLRNVELTAPYMHNGAYPTLEVVVRHYTNADSALRNFDGLHLPPELRASYRNDPATISAMQATMDSRVRFSNPLTQEEQRQLVAFLKSLTDPAARDMRAIEPSSVPSGIPVRD